MSTSTPAPDHGIDMSLHEIALVGSERLETGVRIDIQAKATTPWRSLRIGWRLQYWTTFFSNPLTRRARRLE